MQEVMDKATSELRREMDLMSGLRRKVCVQWTYGFSGEFYENPIKSELQNLGFVYEPNEAIWFRFMGDVALHAFFDFCEEAIGYEDLRPPMMVDEGNRVFIEFSDTPLGYWLNSD